MKICVYGGASSKIDESFIKEGEKLGKSIVRRGHSLVFGGGRNGMMGAVARGVSEKNGEIIGEGYNTREKDKDPIGHAEINAIKEASKKLGDWRLTGCRLYVTLEPCRMCCGAIMNSRIETVIYGADDMNDSQCNQEELNKNSPSHKVKVYRNFMEDECKKELNQFFSNLRNK